MSPSRVVTKKGLDRREVSVADEMPHALIQLAAVLAGIAASGERPRSSEENLKQAAEREDKNE